MSWQPFCTEVVVVWAPTALSCLGTCVGDGLAFWLSVQGSKSNHWLFLVDSRQAFGAHLQLGLIRTAGACSGSGSTLSTAVCEMGLFCVENDYSPR